MFESQAVKVFVFVWSLQESRNCRRLTYICSVFSFLLCLTLLISPLIDTICVEDEKVAAARKEQPVIYTQFLSYVIRILNV